VEKDYLDLQRITYSSLRMILHQMGATTYLISKVIFHRMGKIPGLVLRTEIFMSRKDNGR